MEEYMLDKNRVGSFPEMYAHAVKQVLKRNPELIAECAGVTFDPDKGAFVFDSLGKSFTITYPQCVITFTETGQAPYWMWQLVLLHYLGSADGAPLSGELVAFRNMQQGLARKVGFESDTAKALTDAFGKAPVEQVKQACQALGAVFEKANADIKAAFYICPRYPVTLQLWMVDEEMPAEAQVLFDSRATHYLPAEGAEYSGTIIVDFLKSQYMLMFPK